MTLVAPVIIRDRPRSGWALSAGILVIVVAAVYGFLDPGVGLAAYVAVFAVLFVLSANSRLFTALVACTTPYAVGALFGALAGIRFYPFPDLDQYWSASREQLQGLLLTLGVGTCLGIGSWLQGAVRSGLDQLLDDGSFSRRAAPIVLVGSVAVAAHDWFQLVSNAGAISLASRHQYDDLFVMGNGPWGILTALLVSFGLFTLAVHWWRHRRGAALFAAIVFLATWAPVVLIGNRNYLSLSLVGMIFGGFTRIRSRLVRTCIAVATLLGAAGLTIVPTLFSDNPLVGYNEWILPNSLFLSLLFGVIDGQGSGAATFWQQSAYMLPSGLRGSVPESFTQIFTDAGVTTVSVGGSPWADFFVDSSVLRPFIFAAGTLALIMLGLLLRRISVLAPLVTVGVMAFWGRSAFWNCAFILVYFSVACLIIWGGSGRPRAVTRA